MVAKGAPPALGVPATAPPDVAPAAAHRPITRNTVSLHGNNKHTRFSPQFSDIARYFLNGLEVGNFRDTIGKPFISFLAITLPSIWAF